MDHLSEVRLAQLSPKLASAIEELIDKLRLESIEVRVTQGLRTWAAQDALYAQGRTEPGKIVTQARGGESWHNFSMAADVAPFENNVPIWDVKLPCWARIVEVGEGLALVSGTCFHHMPDTPHFQLTGRFPLSPDDEVRQLFKDGGAAAVWAESEKAVAV